MAPMQDPGTNLALQIFSTNPRPAMGVGWGAAMFVQALQVIGMHNQ